MKKDKAIFDLIEKEHQRQLEGMELIASENFVSDEVMAAMGSYCTNKYAEGLPGKRYYGGCEVVDEIETLAIERIKNYSTLNLPTYNLIVVHKQMLLYYWQFSILEIHLWALTFLWVDTLATEVMLTPAEYCTIL